MISHWYGLVRASETVLQVNSPVPEASGTGRCLQLEVRSQATTTSAVTLARATVTVTVPVNPAVPVTVTVTGRAWAAWCAETPLQWQRLALACCGP